MCSFLTLRIPSTWGRLHCLQLMFTVEVSTCMNCKYVFRIFSPQDRPKSALSELMPKFDMTCQLVLRKLTRTKVPVLLPRCDSRSIAPVGGGSNIRLPSRTGVSLKRQKFRKGPLSLVVYRILKSWDLRENVQDSAAPSC